MAKATGIESFRPTLQQVDKLVSDEGGKEGKFYEVNACAAEICDERRDVRTLWVIENFINGNFVTCACIAETTLIATCQANNIYDTLIARAGKGTEM